MKGKFILIVSLSFLIPILTFASHKVYVIHGFGGFALQMEKINQGLIKVGYLTENYSYPSFNEDLDSVGIDIFRKIRQENFDSVSFVTHSMGALVVRSMYQYLDSTEHFPFIFRIVMLAPPNKGTEIANSFCDPTLKLFLGPNVEHMISDSNSYANKLPIPDCEIGIIAGMIGNKLWYNPFLQEDNDGLVPYSSTLLGNEKGVVKVNSTHILMTQKNQVVSLINLFLKTGSFKNSVEVK